MSTSSEGDTKHRGSLPVLESFFTGGHEFYRGRHTTAGLSRSPTARGHTYILLHSSEDDLFSLQPDDSLHAMLEVQKVAEALRDYYGVARCALVADGGHNLSIIPLLGLSTDWKRVTSSQQEFHEYFPGYVSSADGPRMDASRLDHICAKIQEVSGISTSHNYRFDGESPDQNLFARIVRGELPQSRVWEDESHVAFLTPFANTPGFTVLVPRAHLGSDIFGLEIEEYSGLVRAAHKVAQVLKSSMGCRRCGMIFEGLEVDYAHVKLIPIHEKEPDQVVSESHDPMPRSNYQETYTGCVDSRPGPLTRDETLLSADIEKIRSIIDGGDKEASGLPKAAA